MSLRKRFVVISGLPASGKTTLARRLAPALRLPVIDKDDILERFFAAKGIGDAAWRRALSRESDTILEREALASNGAVVASFWRLAGMPADSGTPSAWPRDGSHQVITVHCRCDVETAARRFVDRQRHPGHLDAGVNYGDVLAQFQALDCLPPLDVGSRIDVETTREANLPEILRAIEIGWRDSG